MAKKLTAKTPSKPLPGDDNDDLSWLDEGIVSPTTGSPETGELGGRLVRVPISDIVPNEWNPNEMTQKAFDQLSRRMQEVGYLDPIMVYPADEAGKYMIIDGEHRWKVSNALGWPEMDCIILDEEHFKDTDLQKFLTMQANMIRGKLNPEKFFKLYNELSKNYSAEQLQDLMGFWDQSAFKALVKQLEATLPTEELQEEFKKLAAGVKDPDKLFDIVTTLMGKFGNDLRFNFMIFDYEDTEQVWLKIHDESLDIVKEGLAYCRTHALDVNTFLFEAFTRGLEAFKDID